MKTNLFIGIGAIALIASCASKPSNEYVINGSTDLADGEMVYLSYTVNPDSLFKDSVAVANGQFIFNGSLQTPVQASLYTAAAKDDRSKIRGFVIEPGSISVALDGDDYSNAAIEGSALTAQLDSVSNYIADINGQMRGLRDEMEAAQQDSIKMKELMDKYEALYNDQEAFQLNFAKTHPASFVAPMVFRRVIYNLSLDELKEVFNSWTPEVQASANSLSDYIAAMENVQPGKAAVEISGKDQNEKDMSLSNLKGNVVLLDFWATWCGPCRASLPHVKELYDKYHDKGLEVLCVSLDNDEAPWKDYIANSGMGMEKYHHVYERGCGWNSKDAANYAVRSIPAKFLIDKNGIIVGKFSSDEELDAKLAELLAE